MDTQTQGGWVAYMSRLLWTVPQRTTNQNVHQQMTGKEDAVRITDCYTFILILSHSSSFVFSNDNYAEETRAGKGKRERWLGKVTVHRLSAGIQSYKVIEENTLMGLDVYPTLFTILFTLVVSSVI